jgi:hypothetical protein
MSSGMDKDRAQMQSPPNPRGFLDGRRTYRVVIEDIASGMETSDSFAIKFSLLTKAPLARMKHVVRRLPATAWSGEGRSQAEHVLSLIEEAGGKGRIVEIGDAPSEATGTRGAPAPGETPEQGEAPARKTANPAVEQSCAMCGFPLKAGEARCGFCMTAVGDAARGETRPEPERPAKRISRKRVLLYAALFVVGVMLVIVLTR